MASRSKDTNQIEMSKNIQFDYDELETRLDRIWVSSLLCNLIGYNFWFIEVMWKLRTNLDQQQLLNGTINGQELNRAMAMIQNNFIFWRVNLPPHLCRGCTSQRPEGNVDWGLCYVVESIDPIDRTKETKELNKAKRNEI